MSNNKEHRALPLGLVKSLQERKKPIIVEFVRFGRANFEIDGVVAINDPILYIKSDDFVGIVPKSEFSIQKVKPSERLVGKTRLAYVHSEYQLENPDGSKQVLVIFSTREYEQELKQDAIDEIVNSAYVTATVLSFTEYGAMLQYKGLTLELNDGAFSGKSVPARTVLSTGDEIDVVFRKFRNGGRKILVQPRYQFPMPDYMQPRDRATLEKGQVFTAKIRSITPNSVLVSIGRDHSRGQNQPILVSCRPPHPAVAQYLTLDTPVRVKLTKVGDRMHGSIEEINRDFVDDAIFAYRDLVAQKQAEKGGQPE